MKKNRIIRTAIFLVSLLIAGLFTSCAAGTPKNLAGSYSPQTLSLSAKGSDYSDAGLDFSLELLKTVAKEEGEENILISPVSIFLALGMTANGSNGTTLQEFEQVLGRGDFSLRQINEMYSGLIEGFQTDGEDMDLHIANSLWFRDDVTPRVSFLQATVNYYSPQIYSLNFENSSALDTINKWVEDNTNGLIDRIVEEIDPGTTLFLVNSLYFKTTWSIEFSPAQTYPDIFTARGRSPVSAAFMHADRYMTVLESQDAIGVLLPYKNTSFSFFALLPQDEAVQPQEMLAGMNSIDLSDLMSNTHDAYVYLSLPSFEASYSKVLNEPLMEMGLGSAFDEGADFSMMLEDFGKGDLCIDEVLHKTFIRVNEKGTEAAAVTEVTMAETSAIIDQETLFLNFDRPFLYGIWDEETGLPLFLGILQDPTAEN